MKRRGAGEQLLIERIQRAIVNVRDVDVLLGRDAAKAFGASPTELAETMRSNPLSFRRSARSEPLAFKLTAAECRRVLHFTATDLEYDPSDPPLAFTASGLSMVATRLGRRRAKAMANLAAEAFAVLRRRRNVLADLTFRLHELQRRLDKEMTVFDRTVQKVDAIVLALGALLDEAQAAGLGDCDAALHGYQPF